MKYLVSGKFTVQTSGAGTIRLKRTVEADSETEAIEIAVDEEIDEGVGSRTEIIDVEVENTKGLTAIQLDDLPADAMMIYLGPQIAPRLF